MAKVKNIGKSIEETYQKLSLREQILLRPDTWIGSLEQFQTNTYIVDDIKEFTVTKKDISYVPGFLKIFDEILTNASDHAIRCGKVKNIDVTITKDTITVENDGEGIPVVMHKEHKVYVPELIFFHLMSGSNYDDTEKRLGGGRNGIGSKAANIYSTEFIVETCDGKKKFKQSAKDNLAFVSKPTITDSKKQYTKITFKPDLTRFKDMIDISGDILKLMYKRVLDIAAYCAPKTTLSINGIKVPIKSIKEYMELHLDPETPIFYEKINDFWEVGFAPSKTGKFEQVSIVNGITTYRGGTHVTYISKSASEDLTELILKGRKKIDLNWTEVRDKMCMFLISKIYNPVFDTQTKEYLTTSMTKDITQGVKLSEKTIKSISKSEIVQAILDHIELRELQALKKMNKTVKKVVVAKLIEAKGSDRNKCVLGLFEGDCLEENTSITVFRDSGILDIPIKNARIDDLVITHNNKLSTINNISKKIAKKSIIKTKLGDLISSKKHQWFVYDTKNNTFYFTETASLDKTKHKLVKNYLSFISDLLKFKKIELVNEEKYTAIITFENSKLDTLYTSNDLKLAVYDSDENVFRMINIKEINIDTHLFVNTFEL